MSASARDMERLLDLLADEAAAELDGAADRELAALAERAPGVNRTQLLQAAALVQVACLRRAGGVERMPVHLRDKLARQGQVALQRQRGPVAVPAPKAAPRAPAPAVARPRPAGTSGLLGWALAAVLALAFVVLRPAGPAPADPVAARAALLQDAPDVVTLPWARPTAPGYQQVTGDVVWSPSRQQGYLRLAGLPANDPARAQYQLWIVDPERDTHPVDGGVFDVSSRGEVVIPIQAKLAVGSPKAFAITREKPGGVVVSAGPLLVVAPG